jgi:pyridoxine 4-dehydrogenase
MSDTFLLGGDMPVRRLGFGAMRICGPGIWGPPNDKDSAIALLREVVELGINLIDTADAYGPAVSEDLIAEALHPYPEGLVIATKGGLERGGPGQWSTNGRPEHLRGALEASLRRLKLERIDLYQLHAIDNDVPIEDSLGMLKELQDAGKIRHIGISNVNTEELAQARAVVDVVSVQNRYNLSFRKYEEVLMACHSAGIGFIPWYPLAAAQLTERAEFRQVAADHDATPAQTALAWLLTKSPVVLPIPGTSSSAHLRENTAAGTMRLSSAEVIELEAMA